MFSMFGRTGAQKKWPPQEERQIFGNMEHTGNNGRHSSEMNKSDSNDQKKVGSFFQEKR